MCPAIEMCYVTLWGWGSKVHLNLSNWSYARDDEEKVQKRRLLAIVFGARLRDGRALLVGGFENNNVNPGLINPKRLVNWGGTI